MEVGHIKFFFKFIQLFLLGNKFFSKLAYFTSDIRHIVGYSSYLASIELLICVPEAHVLTPTYSMLFAALRRLCWTKICTLNHIWFEFSYLKTMYNNSKAVNFYFQILPIQSTVAWVSLGWKQCLLTVQNCDIELPSG